MCRENTSPGLRLIVQMKGGKQNLERVYNFLAMGLSVTPQGGIGGNPWDEIGQIPGGGDK